MPVLMLSTSPAVLSAVVASNQGALGALLAFGLGAICFLSGAGVFFLSALVGTFKNVRSKESLSSRGRFIQGALVVLNALTSLGWLVFAVAARESVGALLVGLLGAGAAIAASVVLAWSMSRRG